MDFNRGKPRDGLDEMDGRWNAWIAASNANLIGRYDDPTERQVAYPQPMLTDIEFDVDGSLILGFRDRLGDQVGHDTQLQGLGGTGDATTDTDLYTAASGGDLNRACWNGTTWEWEGTGSCPTNQNSTGEPDTGSEATAEFYNSEFFRGHQETAQGGLAFSPAFQDVASTVMDPIATFSGGVNHFDNTNGRLINTPRTYQVFRDTGASADNGLFGKANGLGDLEYICEAAPIELGNRVWWDDNLNGVQDPGTDEGPIAGVTLELYLVDASDTLTNGQDLAGVTSTLVATTQTDAEGRYYFSSVDDSTNVKVPAGYVAQSWVSGTEVLPNRTYQIRIPDWDGSTGGNAANATAIAANLGAGETLFLAPGPNTGAGSSNVKPSSDSTAINTIQDTDAYDNPGNAAIVVDTGSVGQNNHSLDFAFGGGIVTEGTITIVKNTLGTADGTFTFTSPDSDLDAVSITTASNVGSSAVITKTAGTYTITEDALAGWTLTDISVAGDTTANSASSLADSQAVITLDADENITVTFTNAPDPIASLSKTLVSPASGSAAVGSTVSFALRVENTGPITVSQVTLVDTYDPNYLTFGSAAPTESSTTANTITWSGVDGDGGSLDGDLPLAPGGAFTVTVNFTATRP